MMQGSNTPRDSFSSKFGVVAVAAGSAIGLGNIWRFPSVTAENGGAAFLFIYLLCILILGIPVMLSEFMIGRSAQRNPYGAFKKLAPRTAWYITGLMGVLAAFMILAWYAVVSGWTLEYIYQSFTGNLIDKSQSDLQSMFTSFRDDSYRPLLWFFIFMGLTAWIIIAGVRSGIEKVSKVLMPLLLVVLIFIAIYALTLPGSFAGVKYLFNPDFSKITPDVIFKALGQAFFSLSIGMGTLITYGSYIKKKDNLAGTTLSVVGADTFIAVLAGIAIFPAVFALKDVNDLEFLKMLKESGEALMFSTLPSILNNVPGGQILSAMFFILLAVAALTSTISMLEVIVAFLTEEFKISRRMATISAALSVSIMGVLSVLFVGVFKFLQFASVNILLPLGGLLIVLFVGWYLSRKFTFDELSNNGKLGNKYIPVFLFLVKFIAPIAIAMVFVYGIINALK